MEMCDYSLMVFPNRLARENEILVTYRFPTGSIGFVSPAELTEALSATALGPPKRLWDRIKASFVGAPSQSPVCAVCVPPGARLTISNPGCPELSSANIRPGEQVTFTQTTAVWGQFRDAVRTSSGQEILLQQVGVGFEVQILSLVLAEDAPAHGRTLLVMNN